MKKLHYVMSILAMISTGIAYAESALTIEATHPDTASFQQKISASGQVEAKDLVLVNSQVNGLRLSRILVDEGTQVRKGQILAQFDDQLVQQQSIQAKARLKQADIAYKEASKNAGRASQLLKSDAISQVDGQKMILGAQSAKAQLEAARAQYEMQQLQMQYASVTAPVDGVISSKKATLGMTGMPGQPLFQIIANNQLVWKAKIPGRMLAGVKLNQSAMVDLDDGSQVEGHVEHIAPTIDSQTRQATVSVSLPSSPLLRAGMFLHGALIEQAQNSLSIPASSLLRDDSGPYVWLIKDGAVHRTAVKIGAQSGNRIAVLDGLAKTDQIVLRGGGLLNEGDKVNIAKMEGQ